MNNEIFTRLKAFVVKETGVEEEDVTPDASLENDLGVYGDDGVELIIKFGKELNVDISRFMAADYFSPEGDPILPAIIRLITGKKQRKLKELTLQHLEWAIRAGRLDEEVISRRE
jgi:acyl carrier protein